MYIYIIFVFQKHKIFLSLLKSLLQLTGACLVKYLTDIYNFSFRFSIPGMDA